MACMGEGGGEKCAFRLLVERHVRKSHFEGPGVDRRVILKYIFKKWDGKERTGLIWHRIGIGFGSLQMR